MTAPTRATTAGRAYLDLRKKDTTRHPATARVAHAVRKWPQPTGDALSPEIVWLVLSGERPEDRF